MRLLEIAKIAYVTPLIKGFALSAGGALVVGLFDTCDAARLAAAAAQDAADVHSTLLEDVQDDCAVRTLQRNFKFVATTKPDVVSSLLHHAAGAVVVLCVGCGAMRLPLGVGSAQALILDVYLHEDEVSLLGGNAARLGPQWVTTVICDGKEPPQDFASTLDFPGSSEAGMVFIAGI